LSSNAKPELTNIMVAKIKRRMRKRKRKNQHGKSIYLIFSSNYRHQDG
jgi:hypothetical protein